MANLHFHRDWEKEEPAGAEKAVTREEFQHEWTLLLSQSTVPWPEEADGLKAHSCSLCHPAVPWDRGQFFSGH